MAIGYSFDLKIRALNLIDNGKKVTKVAEMLNISRSALTVWLRIHRKGEDIKPKKNWQRGYGHKIVDLEIFKKFVDENNGLTLKEMAEKWGGVRKMSIQRALKKIGYSKKKDLWIR